MLTFLKNVFKKGELRRKVIFTLGILFVYRLGAGITIPGVNVGSLSSSDATNGIFGIMNLLGGGTLERFSLFALGVSPYITSSIIIELLSMDVIPALTRWRKEGNTGKKKKDRVTRVLTLLLAALQGGVLTYAFDTSYNILVDTSIWSYIYVVLIMMAGSMLAIWLGDQITNKGIGNGQSLLIMASIVLSLPAVFTGAYNAFVTSASYASWLGILFFICYLIMYLLVIVGIVWITLAERRIPIQYANKTVSAYKAKESYLPLKINYAGVMPVIFASMLLTIPSIIVNLIGNQSAIDFVSNYILYTSPTGFVLYIALIVFFSYFYTFMAMNPEEMSKDLNKSGAYIPGVRPGVETTKYINKVVGRLTLVGSIFIAVLAGLPILISNLTGLSQSIAIGGTGILIVVGVAIETFKQIQSGMVARTYSHRRMK